LNFNDLHSVISQKIEHFITTAVRTSNPRERKLNGDSFSLILWQIDPFLGRYLETEEYSSCYAIGG
jgi:hypothetical protein